MGTLAIVRGSLQCTTRTGALDVKNNKRHHPRRRKDLRWRSRELRDRSTKHELGRFLGSPEFGSKVTQMCIILTPNSQNGADTSI